ncbi:type II toxin-antitoxin system HicB family antitoxin [bacterium]|nr:type II toxin-antitoxin system HicB family antitoxin [bacterium]
MDLDITFRVEIFEEDGQYVSLCPELNLSSFGNTPDEARAAIREAIDLFLEECEEMGTLKDVLEEAGFKRITSPREAWVCKEPVSIEKLHLTGV